MKRFVFMDLDNTIVRHQSRALEGAKIVGTDESGHASTVMTTSDLEFYQSILEFGTVIPTTGRSMTGYARLFGLEFSSFAILNHGATILTPDSSVDAVWLERTQKIVRSTIKSLLEVYQQLLLHISSPVKLHQEHGLPLYISVRAARTMPNADLEFQRLKILEVLGSNKDFELLHTGRITSVIPCLLNKKAAVLEVMDRLGDIQTLGVGDALTDLPFMRLCDFQRAPENSEIQNSEWRI